MEYAEHSGRTDQKPASLDTAKKTSKWDTGQMARNHRAESEEPIQVG